MTKKLFIILLAVLTMGITACDKQKKQEPQQQEQKKPTPPDDPVVPDSTLCNPNASAKAQQLYKTLWELQGQKIISGTVANVDWNIKEAENVYGWTKQWPVLNVFDFIHYNNSKDVNPSGWLDYSDITIVKNWAAAGGLVGAMWHWNQLDNSGKNYTCTPGNALNQTSFNVRSVMTTDSPEYQTVIKQMDQIAGYLKKMQEAGIVVIWRPLHEGAGNIYNNGTAWFWWGTGGADAYIYLWKLMYDRFTNYHKLNNLIWVWTGDVKGKAFYPGDAYVDVIGCDSYSCSVRNMVDAYTSLRQAFPKKIITLSECGNGDQAKLAALNTIWAGGATWSWFMTWYDYDYNTGKSSTHGMAPKEWWQAAFRQDFVLTRDKWNELFAK